MSEQLAVDSEGWVRWFPTSSGFGDRDVRLRFADRGGRLVAVELRVSDESAGLNADVLRGIPLGRLERWVNAAEVADAVREALHGASPSTAFAIPRPRVSPTINVPVRRGREAYPDAFYRRVSKIVSAGISTRAIAEANHVPMSTVNRWIKGARERGFLTPSKTGSNR